MSETDVAQGGGLTAREYQIAKLIIDGKNGNEISTFLVISYKTYSTHRGRVLSKLGLRDNAGLVRWYYERKLLGIARELAEREVELGLKRMMVEQLALEVKAHEDEITKLNDKISTADDILTRQDKMISDLQRQLSPGGLPTMATSES